MPPQAIELLERRLSRLRDEHENQLPFQDNEALKTIDIQRRATIPDAYEGLLSGTATALSQYLQAVRSNVLQIADETTLDLSAEDRDAILRVASTKLDPSLYLKRFDLFGEAIGRHYDHAGMSIELQQYQTDIYRARQQAGTGTTISRFLASLSDDLDHLIQRKQRIAAESHKSAPDVKAHWTSHWGFWLTAVATVAGVAGTFRAFVPAASAPDQRQTPSASSPALGGNPASSAAQQASQASRAPK